MVPHKQRHLLFHGCDRVGAFLPLRAAAAQRFRERPEIPAETDTGLRTYALAL